MANGGLISTVGGKTLRQSFLRHRSLTFGKFAKTPVVRPFLVWTHSQSFGTIRDMVVDTIVDWRGARTQEQLEAAKAITFKQCAATYIRAHRAGWRNSKHAAQWEATLNTYAEPIIGSLAVQDVDTSLVMRVLEQHVSEGPDKTKSPLWAARPETASRLRGRMETILDWARVREYRSGENPARWRGHLDKLLPARSKVRKVKHHAALPFADLPDFMAALRT